jgi:hypothetical protein
MGEEKVRYMPEQFSTECLGFAYCLLHIKLLIRAVTIGLLACTSCGACQTGYSLMAAGETDDDTACGAKTCLCNEQVEREKLQCRRWLENALS